MSLQRQLDCQDCKLVSETRGVRNYQKKKKKETRGVRATNLMKLYPLSYHFLDQSKNNLTQK